MEDVTDLLNRIKNQIGGEESLSDEELNRQLNAIYSIYAAAMGPEQLIVQASRFNAVKYIHDENPKSRLIGMERLILESRDYHRQPTDEEIPAILDKLEDKVADILSRQAVERSLEKKIEDRLEERHKEYIEEVRREIIEEETGSTETAESNRKLEKLRAMEKVSLTATILQVVRPQSLSEIIGQDQAVEALASRISSPYPQHLLLYGPPGVGKTTAARLVLEEAKKKPYTVFQKDAPFIECDGTTLRWDSRDMTNPLIGSVHDPLYQGARQELADEGIPEPKPGLVTDAHGGILFIDEIGELDPILLNKLLKVLEDKRVRFDSAYYDEEDPQIPAYIKQRGDQPRHPLTLRRDLLRALRARAHHRHRKARRRKARRSPRSRRPRAHQPLHHGRPQSREPSRRCLRPCHLRIRQNRLHHHHQSHHGAHRAGEPPQPLPSARGIGHAKDRTHLRPWRHRLLGQHDRDRSRRLSRRSPRQGEPALQ